jgi:hypothetical protein
LDKVRTLVRDLPATLAAWEKRKAAVEAEVVARQPPGFLSPPAVNPNASALETIWIGDNQDSKAYRLRGVVTAIERIRGEVAALKARLPGLEEEHSRAAAEVVAAKSGLLRP